MGLSNLGYILQIEAVNGNVTKDPDLSAYPADTQVLLSAVSNDDYQFSEWSGDAQGEDNPLTITMDSNKNLTANFIPIEEAKPTEDVPIVNAGPFQAVILPSKVILRGTTSIDEKNLGKKLYLWCKVLGPGKVTFANPHSLITTASFEKAGGYQLLLTAVDRETGNSGNAKIFIRADKEEKNYNFFEVR